MKDSIVYVTQEATKRDPNTGETVPLFDLTPAAMYGRLEFILPSGPVMLSPAPMITRIKRVLANYDPDKDYLLLISDPAVIAATAAVASRITNGRFNMLKWDRKIRQYIQINVNLGATNE